MSRRRRGKWLLLALAAVALTGTVLAAMEYLRESQRDRESRLGEAQWQRLVQRLSRRAAIARPKVGAAAAVQPASPTATPPVEPVSPATRLPLAPADPEVLARQAEEYASRRPKSVVELQRYRRTTSIAVEGAAGRRGTATLVNFNPTVNAWYLLKLSWDGGAESSYHLANAKPAAQDLVLDPANPTGLTIVGSRQRRPCDLWSDRAPLPLEAAASLRSPYALLCEEQVALRLKTPGSRTTKEWATDFLRDNVWGGERITVFIRRTFFADAYLSTASPVAETEVPVAFDAAQGPGLPADAHLHPDFRDVAIAAVDLGITLEETADGSLAAGRWYRARDVAGILVSAIQPGLVDPDILRSHRDVTAELDDVERRALAYMVAFDLERFELGFALGTDHPRVGWSERVPDSVREPALPGPDGIDSIAPLVATGIVPPSAAERTVVTFTGGFKRGHGAFRAGDLAFRNAGTHYGFVESGVVLSKLQPGLSTLAVLNDGTVLLKTWAEEDDSLLGRIAFARQNGVPIIELDPASGTGVPGPLVARWSLGNWSGSQDKKFRTVRAGVCLQEHGGKRFLLYGYFSSATPSAMARVFQAYDCRYAMLTDMNALEHTYLALYRVRDGRLEVEHLVRGMNVLDKTVDGQVLPRFLGFADNRDFFYLLRRAPGRTEPRGVGAGG